MKQLSGGSINFNKSIKRLAKITHNNYLNKKYETNDVALQVMWQPFIEAIEDTNSLPDGAVKRGLLAYSEGTKLQSSDLIDLAAGKCNRLFFK